MPVAQQTVLSSQAMPQRAPFVMPMAMGQLMTVCARPIAATRFAWICVTPDGTVAADCDEANAKCVDVGGGVGVYWDLNDRAVSPRGLVKPSC